MSKDRPRRDDPDGSEGDAESDRKSGDTPEGAEHDSPPGGGGDTLSVDDVFELLARPGNRYILTYILRSEASEVTYSDLVEHVLDSATTPDSQDRSEFRGRIAARLVHSNLPKLEAAGLVAVDDEAQTVAATDSIDVVVPYLELAMEQSLEPDT